MPLTDRQKRLNRTGLIILVVGLTVSAAIYLVADRAAPGSVGYDLINGEAVNIPPEQSKKYIHDLEVYGGKMAVMADEMNRWFYSLWRGRNLAFTIAAISAVVASGFFLMAKYEVTLDEEDEEERNGRRSE